MFVLDFRFPDCFVTTRMQFRTWGALESWRTKVLELGGRATASFEPR